MRHQWRIPFDEIQGRTNHSRRCKISFEGDSLEALQRIIQEQQYEDEEVERAMALPTLLKPDLGGLLPVVAEGKVRVVYELNGEEEKDEKEEEKEKGKGKLLFVATDRISANDVVMKNVRE